MMRLLTILLFFSFSLSYCAQELRTYFDYKVFRVPGEGHLLELYFNIDGRSVQYQALSDSTEQAEVELKVIVHRGQSEAIEDFKKESIKSPVSYDGFHPDFLAIQRFLLPKGSYSIDIEALDVKAETARPMKMTQPIDLDYKTSEAGFSDIELLAGFRKATVDSEQAKSGIDMLPLMSTVFGTEFQEMFFYFELYGMNKELGDGEPFLLTYFLEDVDREIMHQQAAMAKRVKASAVLSEMAKLDISQVATGKYNLRLEARDRMNELLFDKELPIFRINDSLKKVIPIEEIDLTFVGSIENKDTLLEYIQSLRPIAEELERNIIDQQSDAYNFLECKSFFYSFWEERDPFAPDKAWAAYKKKVLQADEEFGTSNRRGFETDMGRVFLLYGEPNHIANETNDPGAYPYQIWHYYKAGKYNDKRFVFYDPEILQREYTLLHSDVPGEVRNPRWNIIITSRTHPLWNTDNQSGLGSSAERLQQLYESPR